MAAHGLLCQLSFSYSWEKLQFGSAGPEHFIFTSTIKSSLLQVPLLTLLHFILCCPLLKSSLSCKNLIFFYIHVQISIQLNPTVAPITPKHKKWTWLFYNCKKGTANDHMHCNTFLYFTYSLLIIPFDSCYTKRFKLWLSVCTKKFFFRNTNCTTSQIKF